MVLPSFFPPLLLALLIAVLMLAVMLPSIYLFKFGKSGYSKNFALFLSLEMIGMNVSFYQYSITGSALSLVTFSSIFMFGGFLIFIRKIGNSVISIISFSISLVIAEGVMGGFIYSLLNNHPSSLISAISSPWFVIIMEIEMAFSFMISYRVIAGYRRLYLSIIILLMPLYPNLYASRYAIVWISAVIMIIGTALVFDTLFRLRMRKGPEVYLSIELMSVFAAMMIGQFYFFITGNWILFDLAMLVIMTWFIYRVFVEPSRKTQYASNKTIAFLLVLTTFVMEWFMGGVLEFNQGQFAASLSGFISGLSLGWVNPYSIPSIIFDFVSIIVTVTASVWFLIMMGMEMGFLALRKLAVSRIRENKVRLGLMISAYAIYSIFIPFFSPISGSLKFIPYMWAMGIGTNGSLTGDVVVALAGTYLISAILSFLFGSRQLCSVTCTAPMMYQGTFYDSLKTYNRTTKIGKKTLTSKIKNWFKVIAIAVNLIVLATAVISYLDFRGFLKWYIYRIDPSYIAYSLMFNLVWYVGFVMSPLMGTYACVNQGWCYWGTFNQAIGRLGFFRLKVRDPTTCLTCKTVDCAYACPVGLTDMRKSFIDKGEFKAFKCVGVGDCVEACPYDNIFFYDVRHVFKERFLRKRN